MRPGEDQERGGIDRSINFLGLEGERKAIDLIRRELGRSPGLFQVWHANDLEAVHQSRMEREPYMHGYTHVADVEARDLQHAAELTVHTDRDWWLNPEVKVAVVGSRDTAAGDVIVDPQGRAYRFEGYRSFREVEAADLPLLSPGMDRVEQAVTDSRSARSSLLPPPGWAEERQASQERGNVYGQGNGQDKGNEKDQGMSL
jgi:hypothetical protein